MSPIDEAIKQGQRRYQTARHGLLSLLPASGRENTLNRVRESLEEFGPAETSRRLRSSPALFGLTEKVAPEAFTRIESACRELLEARDALDLAISHSRHRDGPGGKLMAFDGELGRVQPDGSVVMLNERSRTQERSLEDDEHDREPEQDGS